MSIGTILLLVLFIAVHLLMHRGHGGHGGHQGHAAQRARREPLARGSEVAPGGHDHQRSSR